MTALVRAEGLLGARVAQGVTEQCELGMVQRHVLFQLALHGPDFPLGQPVRRRRAVQQLTGAAVAHFHAFFVSRLQPARGASWKEERRP